MNISILLALTAFAFVTTVTPGPNNLMLMASGANFGFKRTLPHMIGIVLGFTLLIFIVGSGLMALFETYPVLSTVLSGVSAVYLLWLAWKVATAAPLQERAAAGSPMTLMQAAAFQWVNPKAWAMGFSATTLYAPEQTLVAALWVAAAFGLVAFPAIAVWAWLGTVLRQWLKSPLRYRVFNVTMAVLLVASLYPVIGMNIG